MIIVCVLVTCLSGALGLYTLRFLWMSMKSCPLPPGPPGWPIIGNLTDLPPNGCKEWEHWLKHKGPYGPISSVTVMRQTIIVLNTAEVAVELLQKRSRIYASRPQTVVTNDLTGWNRMVSFQGDVEVARTHRKFIAKFIGSTGALSSFSPLLDLEARRLLLRLLHNPSELVKHIRLQSGATILKLVYGYVVEPFGRDSLVDLADLSTDQFSMAAEPGKWLVDSIPILKYLPSWFPGNSIKRKSRDWKKVLDTLAEKPYGFVLHQRAQQQHKESYVSRHLDDLGDNPDPEEEFVIKWTAAAMYGAGADTTVSAIRCFYLAMSLFSGVQHKAWEEIDRVVGSERLPTVDDRNDLPYINALLQEVLRWHPVAPLGLAHMAIQDDEFGGYRIPKGAVLVPNIWAFTHDPDTYHDPMLFNPERFLNGNTRSPECDPRNLVFGFGRRICPGRFIAESTLFLTIAKSIATFRIGKTIKDGHEVDSNVDFQPGVISHPAEYDIRIQPRTVAAEQLIRSVETEHPLSHGDSQVLDAITH